MCGQPRYSDNADYIVAAIMYLATNKKWWSRTVPMMAKELSLDEGQLRIALSGFPGIFRKSFRPSTESGEHMYSLQARYALKEPEGTNEPSEEDNEPSEEDTEDVGYLPNAPVLAPEHINLLLQHVSRSVAAEHQRDLTHPSNWIAILAALTAGVAAVVAAVVAVFFP